MRGSYVFNFIVNRQKYYSNFIAQATSANPPESYRPSL
ncbi:hypothetical protein XACJK48_4270002 [Xanthomonas citri pv. citri]|nr:hypothetical protein XACS584_670005 [Xanthomonas citri pv. citri]CEH42477.1 hypothetical protein XACLE3_4050002 [Xanthomonas citri pv. citri]CEH42725.1 hypothetical protein XACJK48_4270002 [Xanthomonas citri pv. citri]CEH75013.1 hypothetical protein XACS582_6540002 [Xanthomonas citri pv. citri]CEH81298.1 hypothetical protein XACS581_1110046 [Xanthomonas citri pv. citri]